MFNKPLSITRNGVTSSFSYDANLLRYKQIKTGLSGGTQTTYHVDRSLEIEKQGTRTTYRHYIDGIAILNREDLGASTTWTLGFNLKDCLGSVVTLVDDSGTVLEHRSYDPFGKPRQGGFIDAGTIQVAIAGDPHPELNLDPLTDRGFTDHEHLDEQDIIHMNGRVFDYNIGRFSSVDPFIQAPSFSQSVNPYSYIMNNPLAGTDPSGYESDPPKEETDVGSEEATSITTTDSMSNGLDTLAVQPTSGVYDTEGNYDTSQPLAPVNIRQQMEGLGGNVSSDLGSQGFEEASGADYSEPGVFEEAMTNALTGQGLDNLDDPAQTMADVTAVSAVLIVVFGEAAVAEMALQVGTAVKQGFLAANSALGKQRMEFGLTVLGEMNGGAAIASGQLTGLQIAEAGVAFMQANEMAAAAQILRVTVTGTTIIVGASK